MSLDTHIHVIIQGAIWSIGLYVACYGLGEPIRKIIFHNETLPKWTATPIGVSIFVQIASILDMTHTATRTNLTITWLMGITSALLIVRKELPKIIYINKDGLPSKIFILITAFLFVGLGSWAVQDGGNWDDTVGYVPVCHEVESLGTSWAPLSLRRAANWGGEYPLQTLGMLWTADRGSYIYDKALGALLMLGIAFSLRKSAGGWIGGILGCLSIVLPQTNLNSAPNCLLAPIFLTLLVGRKNPFLFGLMGAVSIGLRFQSIPFIAALWVATIIETRKDRGGYLQWGTFSATSILIGISAFAWTHYKQFHTPLPMLSPGTIDPHFLHFKSTLKETGANMIGVTLMCAYAIFAFSILVYEKTAVPVILSALFSLYYMTFSMSEFSQVEWQRYSYPAMVTAAIWGVIQINKNNKENNKWVAKASLLTLALFSLYPIRQTRGHFQEIIRESNMKEYSPWFARECQINSVPAGKALAVLVLEANMLDYSRNRIINLDVFPSIGNVPTNNNPQEWKKWAKKQGIEYLMHINFEVKTPNGKSIREAYTNPSIPGGGDDLKYYRRVIYPKQEEGMNYLESIEKTIPCIHRGFFTIIDFCGEGFPNENKKDTEKNPNPTN